MIGAIDHTAMRSPGFLTTRVRNTWLRREVPDEWFMLTRGGGDVTVMELRAALVALVKREGAEQK